LISVEQRKMAISLIKKAVDDGARQKPACEVVGISVRTLQRWRAAGLSDRRQTVVKTPSNKLNECEQQEVLNTCNSNEFKSMSPKQIVPALADRGVYIASESTFYRLLRKAGQLKHRGKYAVPEKRHKPTEYVATDSNQVWSWDITYLARNIKGSFFYLYLYLDIFSRKIVGWDIYENESSEHAAEILKRARYSENLSSEHSLVLHSDNGSPMKGATMLATMQALGIVQSFSRPSVSNDNPYSEAMFKTLKYVPAYPSRPFDSIKAARSWMVNFTHWYNNVHLHSSIKFVTPESRHQGQDKKILEQRKKVYLTAKEKYPDRWSSNIRNWNYKKIEYLNPNKKAADKQEEKAA